MTLIKILDRDLPFRLEWLRSFLVVAEQEGYTEAAKVLHLSQPAVWTHIRELEANLGTKLLENVGGKTRLTRGGDIAAREARRLLTGVRDFRDAVADLDAQVQGILALGASTTPGNYILPALMREFELAFPKAKATLSIGNSVKVLDGLRANEFDIAVVGIKPSGGGFVTRPLCEDELVLFASSEHPLAERGRASIENLSTQRLIVREPDSATRSLTDQLLSKTKVRPLLMELGCPETVKKTVAAGLGLGVLSNLAIANEVRHGELVRLKAPGFPIRRTLYTVYLKRKHINRMITGFIDLLVKAAKTATVG